MIERDASEERGESAPFHQLEGEIHEVTGKPRVANQMSDSKNENHRLTQLEDNEVVRRGLL